MAASFLWAAATLTLTLVASIQGNTHRMRAWPDWRQLSGGGSGGDGWFAEAVELLAVVPVLVVVTLSHMALHPVVRMIQLQLMVVGSGGPSQSGPSQKLSQPQ